MSGDMPAGNATLLEVLVTGYRLQDCLFPPPGNIKYVPGYPWRIGLRLDGRFSWIANNDGYIQQDYLTDTLATIFKRLYPFLPLRITCYDFAGHEKNILIMRARIACLSCPAPYSLPSCFFMPI